MDSLVRAISKMFVVLVLLFGNPPPVSLRELARRPTIALVTTARRPRADGFPPLGLAPPAPAAGEGPGAAHPGQSERFPGAGRDYLPVQAA